MKTIGTIIEYSNRLWLCTGDPTLFEETIIMACVTGSVGSETRISEIVNPTGYFDELNRYHNKFIKNPKIVKQCKVSSIKKIEKIKPS